MKEELMILRKEMNIPFIQIKKIYDKAGGDIELARKLIREDELRIAKNRTAKLTKYSTIGYYIHTNQRIGSLVELACESDLMAATDEFNEFANQIAMHVAVMNPRYLSLLDLKEDEYMKQDCLLEQKFFQDENKTIQEMLMDFIYEKKENVEIKRFVCFEANKAYLKHTNEYERKDR